MLHFATKPEITPADPLESGLDCNLPNGNPEALHQAMRYVVFSGGKRVRPRLLLAVASACQVFRAEEVELAMNAACAVEFIHCASLVHDDLPAFDNADQRRGRPTVHVLYGEPLAVLVGDALLTRAFEVAASEVPQQLAPRALRIVRLLGTLTGSAHGIIGGQSLESASSTIGVSDPDVEIELYHAMKTGALFRFAAEAGATAAGIGDTSGWAEFGYCLGLAYQLGDDFVDTYGRQSTAGKPVGRDLELGRPNAVILQGEVAARRRLSQLLGKTRNLAISLAKVQAPLLTLLDEVCRGIDPGASWAGG